LLTFYHVLEYHIILYREFSIVICIESWHDIVKPLPFSVTDSPFMCFWEQDSRNMGLYLPWCLTLHRSHNECHH